MDSDANGVLTSNCAGDSKVFQMSRIIVQQGMDILMPIDYSRYPPNWKTLIVPAILDRAMNKCESCGVQNGVLVHSVPIRLQVPGNRWHGVRRIWMSNDGDVSRIKKLVSGKIKKVKVVLTVAHLDHDEENHDVMLDRLRAWCQYCHLGYDAQEKFKRACNKKGDE